jgi:vacuolar-type H+-ATPase subunit I/STV1
LNNNAILEIANLYRELRDKKDALNAELKELQEQICQTEKVLSEEMINNEVQKFTLDGYTYYLNTRTKASPVAKFKQEVYQWLKDNGYGDLVYETVNANSFSAFVSKDLLAEVDELPKELQGKVNVYEQITIGMRKSR